MSSAGNQAATPQPSVFISYASEDRAAARLLRDALEAAGLDVWYDESELGGGDAWDQKIRRQIRDCEYFLPVISSTTERRKEGYFRREWRLAAERTMDMADDVLFLLPVTIDGTTESNARVPEKFLHVQWLRAPGGRPTPAFASLIQRLLAGEHHALPRPPSATRTPLVPPDIMTVSGHATPPPMPPFPHAPEKGGIGQWLKFIAEILWWIVTATWMVVVRLPRWLRVGLSIWVITTLMFQCNRLERRQAPPRKKETPAVSPAPAAAANTATAPASTPSVATPPAPQKNPGFPPPGFEPGPSRNGPDGGRRFGKNALDPNAVGKALVLAPFTAEPGDGRGMRFAREVFALCNEKLHATHPEEIEATIVSVATGSDEALISLGRNLGARQILGAHLAAPNGTRTLAVRLMRMPAGTVVWKADYPVDGADVAKVAAEIVAGVEGVLSAPPPKKE